MASCVTPSFAEAYPSIRRLSQIADDKLSALWDACGRDVPGSFAELGVCKGGVGRLMALRCPDRAVHLFDTFTGIPWDGYDARTDGHKPGEFAASLFDVKDALADCPNVVFHPGLFPATAQGLDAERFAVVHLDADLYASTLAGLKWFWPRLSPGGCIVLDDWQWKWCRGVTMAVDEFFADVPHERRETAEHQLTVTK